MHCFVKVIECGEDLSHGSIIGRLSKQAVPLSWDAAVISSLQHGLTLQLCMMALNAADFADSNAAAVSSIG